LAERIGVEIEGVVQGVGFRPFVYRLACRHGLSGWVGNGPCGVVIEAEGRPESLDLFYASLRHEAPPYAHITNIRRRIIPLSGETGFSIVPSSHGDGWAYVAPDRDVCPDCLRELFDPDDRRYRYPFISCTNCGPRYSIAIRLPYDRENTTMADFALCALCRGEYEDPSGRRFHAQTNACPDCGPRAALVDASGAAVDGDPVEEASRLLAMGKILAVKGGGGYHLAVDACNEGAVLELRRRKARGEKPFALMVADLARLREIAWVEPEQERLLSGTERPIMLLPAEDSPIAPSVAPGMSSHGVMLPSNPLQHLLVRDFAALVMTSGNVSDEPVVFRDREARAKLSGIVDYFLVHDRRIHCRTDDSIIRSFADRPVMLRRSRGYAPLGIKLKMAQQQVLAVGGEQKGAFCLTRDDEAFMSPHIGDLKSPATLQSLEETILHMERLLGVSPRIVAHDLHPDYCSTAYALELQGVTAVPVQHHHAHMASCMVDNGLEGEVLGVIFDGTGFGENGEIWGGEFLLGDFHGFKRIGRLSTAAMPGGDLAVMEPWRMALSHCHATFGKDAFLLPFFPASLSAEEMSLLQRMLEKGLNSPRTSSCGRFFDAAAALLGVHDRVSFEGQAAMELEALAEQGSSRWLYPYTLVSQGGTTVIDCRPIIEGIVGDVTAGEKREDAALRFHLTIAAAAADVCVKARNAHGVDRVVLSGGVFQNRLLTMELRDRLASMGFQVFMHREVPPNDGGLALGQAVIAGRSVPCV
jgi:hydrogenase maturation protein HypF